MELTSNRLAAVPKRNSAAVISDYVHSQKAFQKHYAAEGLAVMQALDAPHASAQQIASRQKGRVSRPQDDFLLGTPLLKPRVAAAKAIDSAKQKAKFDKENEDGIRDSRLRMPPASKEDNVQASTKKVQDKRKAKIQQELKKPKSKSKNKGNQALEHAHDDENAEHAQRLEDRRDRKRAKKTIMQPPQANDDEKENSDCDKTKGEKQNRRRKDEGRRGQSKGHASLAFMHGFPSTNIGKHRITSACSRKAGLRLHPKPLTRPRSKATSIYFPRVNS
ncbi:hypothetical protein CPB83DRAFT_217377 [Crepidotus variabilis]|uniref:Uncharacterized protein n=1 Tax=Crepidotus variabilis TaxID=179855 RepID=A0A9P6JVU1_9AGAR|nr:hypothetical protein CPB83DRAFT_217377 [Crepidotus variabilis]